MKDIVLCNNLIWKFDVIVVFVIELLVVGRVCFIIEMNGLSYRFMLVSLFWLVDIKIWC